jgi:hypothetical protein
MPNPTQFALTHQELVALIIKNAGIHEGRWMLSITFGYAPGNFGPTQDQMVPGTVVAISQIGIQREVMEGIAPAGLTVDAAAVNPAPKQRSRVIKPAARASRKSSRP